MKYVLLFNVSLHNRKLGDWLPNFYEIFYKLSSKQKFKKIILKKYVLIKYLIN
jgi:hypothetical protein